MLLAALGERHKAELLLSELTQRINTGDTKIPNLVIAKILVLLNKPVEAIGSLESSIKTNTLGSSDLDVRIQLRFDPVWDPLRGNPRFEALLKAPEQKK